MGRSTAVRASDVRSLMNVVLDACQGSVDPVERKAVFIRSLCSLFRARIGEIVEVDERRRHGHRTFTSVIDCGWDHEAQRREYVRSMERHGPNDPMSDLVLARRDEAFNIRREDVLDDRAWYRCRYYNETLRPADLDALLGCYRRFRRLKVNVGVGLHRACGDRLFTGRDVAMMSLVNDMLLRAYPKALMNPDEPIWRLLPLRRRQTLRLLLEGLSDKEIATRLGVSLHTAHEYVTDLYRRFEVGGRTALMARCLHMRATS